MKRVIIEIDRRAVYTEAARRAAYTAAKAEGDASATARMSLSQENREILDGYWRECLDSLLSGLKRMLENFSDTEDGATVTLRVADRFNFALLESVRSAAFDFMATGVTARWFSLVKKDEAEGYARGAASILEDIVNKLYERVRPQRPECPPCPCGHDPYRDGWPGVPDNDDENEEDEEE
ncbi:MAG: hypothetical protein LUE27_10550 [Clostridia bacterium]|nr:hypothetical protein [Clostridia bacterium]